MEVATCYEGKSKSLNFSGGFANLVTLIAIPYVRQKYSSTFSILHLNSMILILHLSLANLLYSIVGDGTHYLLSRLYQRGLIGGNICYYVSFFGSIGMFLSHTTTSMISCCVARHNICSTCSGVSLSHDTHDKIFGGRKVYLVCAYIWLVTILTLIPDIIRRVKIRQNLILFQFFDAGIWILYFTRVSGYL